MEWSRPGLNVGSPLGFISTPMPRGSSGGGCASAVSSWFLVLCQTQEFGLARIV